MTYWATTGCTYEVTLADGAALTSGDGASVTATYTGPDAATIDGATAMCGSVALVLSEGVCAAVDGKAGAGTASLPGTAKYVSVDGEAALLLGDSVDVSMAGVNSAGVATSWTFTVEITDAGQSSTRAE